METRIKIIREERELPQKAVAAYLMCDQSLYSKYERNEREIPLRLVVQLAQYYQTSVDYLVGLTDEVRPYERRR